MSNAGQLPRQLTMPEFIEEVPLSGVSLYFINLLRQHRETNDVKKAALESLTDKLEFLMTHPSLEHTPELVEDFNTAVATYAALIDDNTEAYMVQLFSICQVVAIRCTEKRPYADILETELTNLNMWNGESLFDKALVVGELPPGVVESELRLRTLVQKLQKIKRLAQVGNMSFDRNLIPSGEVEELINSITIEIRICGVYLSRETVVANIISDLDLIASRTRDIELRARHLADSSASTVDAVTILKRIIIEKQDDTTVVVTALNARELVECPAVIIEEA